MPTQRPLPLRLDATWQRVGTHGRAVLAGSPRRLFRLTDAGARVAARLERGEAARSTLVDRFIDAGAVHPVPDAGEAFARADVTVVTPQLGGRVHVDGRVTVDDGSDPPLRGGTLRLDRTQGPAAARNAGRTVVDTPLIAFVDADVDLPFAPDDHSDTSNAWWAPLLAQFDDSSVALVAPRITGDPGSSLDLGDEPARIRAGTRVSYVPAAMILVRADAFDDVGGFDEALRFGEDVDFLWRLDDAGWQCRYDPRRVVRHRRRERFADRLRQQFGYGSSSAPLAMRHPSSLAPFRSSGRIAATLLLVAGARPLAAIGVAGWTFSNTARSLPGVPCHVVARLTIEAHLAAGRHAGRALRRQWWPILCAASLVSRRSRRLALLTAVIAPGTLTRDLAFGCGVWRSMFRHRTWRPIWPDLDQR